MAHTDDARYALEPVRHQERTATNSDQRHIACCRLHCIDALLDHALGFAQDARAEQSIEVREAGAVADADQPSSDSNIRGCELSTAKCDPLNGQPVSDGERTDLQRVQCYMAAPAEPDGDEIRHAEERAHTPNSDNRIGLAWKSAPELTDIGGGAADIDHNRVCEPRKIGAAAHGISDAERKN